MLSSKIASVVYIIEDTWAMTNENCLNFSIFNKTNHKRSNSTDLVKGQIPILKLYLGGGNLFRDDGYPEDYKTPEGIEILHRLKNFAEVTHRYMYAAKIAQDAVNFFDNRTFTEEYMDNQQTSMLELYYNTTGTEMSFFKAVKNIFYKANTIEEAQRDVEVLLEDTFTVRPNIKELFLELAEGEIK